MADMTNLVRYDDATTPGAHTLIPVSNASQQLVWREDAASVPMDGQVRMTVTWETLKDKTWRASVKLEVPVLETVGTSSGSGYVAAPAVAYVMVGIVTLFAPRRSTIADRANLVKMLQGTIGVKADGSAGSSSAVGATGDTWKNLTATDYPIAFGLIHAAMPN